MLDCKGEETLRHTLRLSVLSLSLLGLRLLSLSLLGLRLLGLSRLNKKGRKDSPAVAEKGIRDTRQTSAHPALQYETPGIERAPPEQRSRKRERDKAEKWLPPSSQGT